jgi:hypothetical protein
MSDNTRMEGTLRMKLRSALRRRGVTVPVLATAVAILAVSDQPPEFGPASPEVETTGLLFGAHRPPVEPVAYEIPVAYPVESSLFAPPEFGRALATRISATALIRPARVQPAP